MTATPDAAVENAETTVPALPDLPLGDRVAADLATLGVLAKTRPELADLIATTVSQLYLVIAHSAPIAVNDVLEAATIAGGTEPTEVGAEAAHEHFHARHVDLPAGVVRLSVLQLDTTTQFGWFNQ